MFKVRDKNGVRGFHHHHTPQAIGSNQAVTPQDKAIAGVLGDDIAGNDIIIGEGDRGDALYIINHGWVKVYKEANESKVIAELRDGDFFGEIALLGDQVRTATVKAMTPTTLLRLTRKDVLALAEEDHELKERLEDANRARLQNDS